MSASTARHETRALLRAHLAAASAYRHLTRHCAVCHRLLRLAMEPGGDGEWRAAAGSPSSPSDAPQAAAGPQDSAGRSDEDESGGGAGSGAEDRAEAGTGAERPSGT
ncbi:DUF6274 family protein [Streptomyces sp. SID14515]|uniref:DUF6274 family protein n=1 Tax=Streptomyces sp. SID14515 TaxID=2706074 RepID=UPI0013C8DD2F|nr:DUF6274 family protein [Streptomyces sp. SID14515]NEB37463.1 hypothetical protein [Streptomyces sp. SID14515]